MRLAIEHTKPAKDRSHADGLRDVAFANASVSEQENVLMCLDESSCRQFEDEGAVNRVEFPIETVERTMVAKAGRLYPTSNEPITTARELVVNQ